MSGVCRFLSPGILIQVSIALWLMQVLSAGPCSAEDPSSSDLVRHFAIQSNSPASSIFNCAKEIGKYTEDHGVADELVKLGSSAIPAIETALDSIATRGRQSEFAFNADWLLYAYARIKGPAAHGRLLAMRNSPTLAFLQESLDHATATSLGLTSYISSSEEPVERGDCRGVIDPGDMLDQLIQAWERNDQVWVERSLGPNAKSALASWAEDRTWAQVRAELWPGKAEDRPSVGYRFTTPGWWLPSHEPVTVNDRSPVNPDIITTFADHSGHECGQYRLTFLKRTDRNQLPAYFVDNSDVSGLLRLIASCAKAEEAGTEWP